jgi:mannosyltransferase
MTIVFDNIVYKLQNAGGISTYWGEISSRLIKDNNESYFIENKNKNKNIVREKIFIPADRIIESENKLLGLERFLNLKLESINKRFIFHSSYNRITTNRNAFSILTIHDFIHEKYYSGIRKYIHSYQKKKAINDARHIISVSENTKNDLLYLHPHISPDSISVIYNGVSENFCFLNDNKGTSKPYLLFIGSREKYKNFDFVISLIKELQGYDLVVVGKPFTVKEEKIVYPFKKRIHLFSNVSNEELNKIYNKAHILLYPSSYEGFGIPLLEAMKCGLPFIALNKSSLPEVAGVAGILVDYLNIDCFKEAIMKVELNRTHFVNLGLFQSTKYSWDKCYQETINLYNTLY